MEDPSTGAGAVADSLRLQIEGGLAQEARERRTRMWLTAAGALLGVSLLLNLLVLVAPGAVGLASASDVDALRSEVAAQAAQAAARDAEVQAALAQVRAATRAAAGPDPALAALPGICATLSELGAWSFVSGAAPSRECPTTP